MNLSKRNMKKTIAVAVTGAFIATGLAYLPSATAFAATIQTNARHIYHNNDNRYHDYAPEEALQDIQTRYGIEKKDLLEYQAKGWRIHELDRAAFIAKTANVPLGDVLTAKLQNKTWAEISDSYGIKKEQYIDARRDIEHRQLAKSLNVKEDAVNKLIADGYHPRDIAMAATLAQKADKSLDTVLSHKKINNTWREVATKLGLSQEAYEACRDDARNCFGGYRHAGNGNGQYARHHWE